VEKARFDKMLSSVEVGTLITALGCGIGREDYDPDKLRYHSIVIMTDADVDGSHIRTLLLTFFYRQMRELIERGHVYIAMPPLYKVRRGKQEQYLKDEKAKTAYVTQSALENASLYVNPDAPPITGGALETLVREYQSVMDVIERLTRVYPERVLQEMITHRTLTTTDLQDPKKVEQWVEDLGERLVLDTRTGIRYEFTTAEDTERKLTLPKVRLLIHGIPYEYTFRHEFFESPSHQAIAELGEKLHGLIEPGAFIQQGERKQAVDTFAGALDWLMREGQKGLTIQRYKGLGK